MWQRLLSRVKPPYVPTVDDFQRHLDFYRDSDKLVQKHFDDALDECLPFDLFQSASSSEKWFW